MKQYWKQFK